MTMMIMVAIMAIYGGDDDGDDDTDENSDDDSGTEYKQSKFRF